MENLLGVSAPGGRSNLTDSSSERCQVTFATGRQDLPRQESRTGCRSLQSSEDLCYPPGNRERCVCTAGLRGHLCTDVPKGDGA